MAHEHLHLKGELDPEHTHGKQVQVSVALLGTLAGGVLLLNYYLAGFIYGKDSFHAEIMAMLGAILLGGPIIWHALKCLIHKHSHMDELVALAIVASFVTSIF